MDNTTILNRIYKSYDNDLKENFVAAAIKYRSENHEVDHAGIAICLNENLYIFHFNGIGIRLDILDPKKWFIENKLDFIKSKEVASFFVYCEEISKECKPEYGYVYNGSFFLPDGKYFSEVEDYQFMTCVGFCINVLTGAIENNKYLLHEDWELADHEKGVYFEKYMEGILESIPESKRKILKNNQRRIDPMDYFTSSFVYEKPISKASIDSLKPSVEKAIRNKFGTN